MRYSPRPAVTLPALFLLGVGAIYLMLFWALDGLHGDLWWDEKGFWQTSLMFSERLVPSLEQLQAYKELNTPLPFILFGLLEHLFQGGIFAGRLLNFGLSLSMVLWIGWPLRSRRWRAIRSAVGLLLFPYYLWLSGHLYTDIIAAFFALAGLHCYRQNRSLLSGICFVLGIASRQYILAFPLGVVAFELFTAYRQKARPPWQILVPTVAALSILGWVLLFQGLAPAASYSARPAPDVQRTLWAVTPGSGLYFLSFIGLYFVIPELLLFWRGFSLKTLLLQTARYRRYAAIALALLLAFILFPPALTASGNLIKVARLLPTDGLKILLFYSLALLACLRFSRPSLACWLLACHALIMLKAYQWDRYALPLLVGLWYLKSVAALELLDSPLRASSGSASSLPEETCDVRHL
ncbi:MAG: hypothetical protein F6J97_07995 [Leptolyngbya sp. SIO4C1]|nr:hypothetical protein [Leptolyngbya sp. SIO4C1]